MGAGRNGRGVTLGIAGLVAVPVVWRPGRGGSAGLGGGVNHDRTGNGRIRVLTG